MAYTTQLRMKFGTMNGEKTWTLNYFDGDTSSQSVNSLMDTMITNGSIYKYPPLSKVSATLVVTQATDYQMT